MRTKQFLGKTIKREKLEALDATVYSRGEYLDEYAFVEIPLNGPEDDDWEDSMGRSYSIQLLLDEEKTARIVRVSHFHMCGGQGCDTELSRFPHTAFEKEPEDILISILKQHDKEVLGSRA